MIHNDLFYLHYPYHHEKDSDVSTVTKSMYLVNFFCSQIWCKNTTEMCTFLQQIDLQLQIDNCNYCIMSSVCIRKSQYSPQI